MSESANDPMRARPWRLSAKKRTLLGMKMRDALHAAEPIAIVGMACRFPGAPDPAQLWDLLRAGRIAVTAIPSSRWDVDAFYDPAPGRPGKMNSRWGGFLDEIDRFDAACFGLTPREAANMDPQHRLLLEVCCEALDEAGQRPDALEGTPTGVFIGICRNDYGQIHGFAEHPERMDAFFGTGNSPSFASGRISYLLGLRGPSLAVDTTCSSSLVAVHLACQSLWSRESRLALAGGVNLMLSPLVNVYLSQVRAFAPDGRCKAFDEKADGYVRAEGCGVVVLKRLSDAVADGDPIAALIRGSAVNHDGRSCGITAPSGPAQEDVLRRALTLAAVPPEQVDYIEAHGTGTALGDPIEVGALAAVYARPERRAPLLIGSIKSNLGHLEAAAGVAGLIKTVLALRHGEVPPQVNFDRPSSRIDWADGRITVATSATPWTPDGVRLAAVSSFGFSGTNAHVVLEEAPAIAASAATAASASIAPSTAATDVVRLLPLSARSAAALEAQRAQWEAFLATAPAAAMAAIGYTAAVRRSALRYRLAVTGDSVAAWRTALQVRAPSATRGSGIGTGAGMGVVTDGPDSGARRRSGSPFDAVPAQAAAARLPIGFAFAGQGSLAATVGGELWRDEPVFRAAATAAIAALGRAGWRREALFETPLAAAEQADPAIVQPVLFSVQWSLAALWRHWGVTPAAVVGHSLGEVAAACVAEALSLEAGARVVVERSRLLATRRDSGAMVAVALGPELLTERLAGTSLTLAVCNSPASCVVAGPAEDVAAWVPTLPADVSCRWLPTGGVAGHSPLVAGLDDALTARLTDLTPQAPTRPYYSAVDGGEVRGAALDATYWGRHLRAPVQFAAALTAALDAGVTTWMELSAHPVLTLAVTECADARSVLAVGSLTRDGGERASMLASAGRLWEAGATLDWSVVAGPPAPVVSLPAYPWQRQRFWLDSSEAPPQTATPIAGTGVAVQLGAERLWSERELDTHPDIRREIEAIVERWSIEGVRAINRSLLAPLVFLARDRQSLVYVNLQNHCLLALFYAGPAGRFASTIDELERVSDARWSALAVLTTDDQIGTLASRGYTTTPFGVLQTLDDLRAFTLEGQPMRRLRYQVGRFAREGSCSLREFRGPADSRATELTALIHRWAAHRGHAQAVADRTAALVGRAVAPHRIFLVGRDDRLQGALVLSPAGLHNGYLLDLEFYADDVPAGCLEWGTVALIQHLIAEGRTYLSLGGTFGTALDHHAGADPELASELAQLHASGVLNGDSNRQFKRKFRPRETRLFLCCPAGRAASLASVLAALTQTPPQVGAAAVAAGTRDSHAFLGKRLDILTDDAIFETRVGDNALPFLAEHRVDGRTIVPGAFYIRQALDAGSVVLGAGAVQISDLAIQTPMFLEPGERRQVQTMVRPSGDEYTFRIASRAPDEWITHALGSLRSASTASATRAASRTVSVADLIARTPHALPIDRLYADLDARGVTYGPSFRRIDRLFASADHRLARIVAPPGWHWSGDLHPVVLDACFQSLAADADPASARQSSTHTYLLRGMDAFTLHGVVPERFWCHAVVHPSVEGAPAVFADMTLIDDSGRVFAEARHVCAKSMPDASRPAPQPPDQDWYHSIGWKSLDPSTATGARARAAGTWVLLCDDPQLNDALERACGEVGGRLHVSPSTHGIAARLADARRTDTVSAVILVSSRADDDARVAATVAGRAASTCAAIRATAHALLADAYENCAFWVVTRGGVAVSSGEDVDPGAGAAWGYGRALALEHPERWGGLIDIGLNDDPLAAAALIARTIAARDRETQVAIRGARRFGARLRSTDTCPRQVPAEPGGTYLIAGGFGGLGLITARWLAHARIASRLVIAGRRGPSAEARRVLDALSGTTIECVQADVSDAAQVARLVRDANSSGDLAGVVHAAGVLRDGLIQHQAWPQFEEVFAAKALGAWHLHRETAACHLRRFLLYSSVAAVFGSPGQSAHAAANAFLDALAHHRRAAGLPAVSINWGPWSGVGHASSTILAHLRAHGVSAFDEYDGARLLGELSDCADAQAIAVRVAWDRWREAFGADQPPFFDDTLSVSVARTPARVEAGAGADTLSVFEAGSMTACVRREIAAVIGERESAVPLDVPISSLGLDSIMTVDLRDRLQRSCGTRIPLALFFREPSGQEIAAELDRLRAAADERLLPELSDAEVHDVLQQLLAAAPEEPSAAS